MWIRDRHNCSVRNAAPRVITAGALACAATLLWAAPAAAQQCGASITPTIDPPNTTFAVGETLTINLTFGPTSVPLNGFQTISSVSVRLDCLNPQGCDFATPCQDGGPHLAYVANSIGNVGCAGSSITTTHGGRPNPNDVVFDITPPVVLAANETCSFSFQVTVLTTGVNASKTINGIAFFLGQCTGGLSASACGTYEFDVINP